MTYPFPAGTKAGPEKDIRDVLGKTLPVIEEVIGSAPFIFDSLEKQQQARDIEQHYMVLYQNYGLDFCHRKLETNISGFCSDGLQGGHPEIMTLTHFYLDAMQADFVIEKHQKHLAPVFKDCRNRIIAGLDRCKSTEHTPRLKDFIKESVCLSQRLLDEVNAFNRTVTTEQMTLIAYGFEKLSA